MRTIAIFAGLSLAAYGAYLLGAPVLNPIPGSIANFADMQAGLGLIGLGGLIVGVARDPSGLYAITSN